MLWVCDKCFKYMAEGASWELHVVRISLLVIIFRYLDFWSVVEWDTDVC